MGLTFGALGAALIAAVVSLIGLILGKEQKTSEFRQEWINSLRTEISVYVSDVSTIADQINVGFKDNNEKLKYLLPLYQSVNKSANLIKLRLNPAEPESRRILDAMDKIEEASCDDKKLSSQDIRLIEDELISETQKLLKKEWDRVKVGERTFRIAKYSAIALLVLLFPALVYGIVVGPAEEPVSSQKRVDVVVGTHTPEPTPSLLPVPSGTNTTLQTSPPATTTALTGPDQQ